MVDQTPPSDQIPATVRARVRTAAQSFAGVLVALLARFLLDRAGVELPGWVADELRAAVEAGFVALCTVGWMWLVAQLSKRWPRVEHLFLLRGKPTYLDVPGK